MPDVIASPRSLRNGEVITEFTDTTSTTAVTYTYPLQQAGISIENSGVADIFVTVGSYANQTVKPNKTWKADVVFTSFSIRSNANSQEFTATAFQNDVEGSGEADSVAREKISAINAQLAETVEQTQESVNFGLNKNTYVTKPLITFIDDDGKIETLTKLDPLMQSKNAKYVSAVSSGKIGTAGYMTAAQILALQSNGHEIASHGVTHQWLSTYLSEIGDSYTALKGLGIQVENLVYIGGNFDNATILEAKKYYNCAIAVGGGVNKTPLRSYALTRSAIAPVTLGVVENGIVQDGSLASYKAMVDYAVANNAWQIFMLHTWMPEYDAVQEQHMSDLIDYIHSLNIEIVTLRGGLKIYGNKIDIGDTAGTHFLVSSDGKVKSSDLSNQLINVYSNNDMNISMTTPYTYFPVGKVHYATFDLSVPTGFPSVAGMLVTYNLKAHYHAYQYWYPYDSPDKVYFRKWDNIAGAWGSLKLLDLNPYIPENISVPQVTIAANSNYAFTVPVVNSALYDVNNNIVLGAPRGGIELGLTWTVIMGSDKSVKLKVYNVTAGSILMESRFWHFKIIK